MSDMILKRGDTFSRRARYVKTNAVAALPLSTTIRAQVRTQVGELISELDVVIEDQDDTPGYFTISKANDVEDGTDVWPLGVHLCDVEYTFTDPAHRTSSRTFTIEVLEDITHD